MPPAEPASLWTALSHAANLAGRALWGAEASVSLGELVDGSSLGGQLERLRDRSILITTRDQLTAALALTELDGIASRIVLCPPDLPVEQVPYVAATAGADAQVFDGAAPPAAAPGVATFVACTATLAPGAGDRADQTILDRLRARYPDAQVAHAFASTEAGVAFDVRDGRAGFPASLIGAPADGGPEMKVENDSLRIRSPRTASRYLGERDESLSAADGFVDTGDIVERRGDRYYFVGRRGGVVNVGGLKVHPEEVEAVLNSHPRVRMSRVRTRKSPITGALVVADVELETATDGANGVATDVEQELLRHCRQTLPRHKIPAAINLVAGLGVNGAGKLVRRDA